MQRSRAQPKPTEAAFLEERRENVTDALIIDFHTTYGHLARGCVAVRLLSFGPIEEIEAMALASGTQLVLQLAGSGPNS